MSLRKINLNLIKRVDYITSEDGSKSLNLPNITENELPAVSVVTITKNRKKFFPICIYNWKHFIYPEQKIEWVILDDGEEDLTDILSELKDPRINYVKLGNMDMDIGDKRNLSIEYCKYEYINHMDDDDFHFPDSILGKVRCLLHYKKEFIYTISLGVYDIISKSSAILENFHDVGELSILYTKNFWNKRKFCNIKNNKNMYEAYTLCKKRETEMLGIDFWFIMISLTHNSNITKRLRSLGKNENASFYDFFPDEFKQIINKLNLNIKNK